ncbi:unnamed protein product [Vitrella brassicaformis CCMP3155]|uniref:Uncharacterized protein n=1 Tax=Vitrella brassicaformis (strain CCMP3155) TaxID=1169540 RepID=A0A0G4GVQ7_VITBC|nr:unnamed protein product [Vitrella brassicaformis CCMP3155]|eukprot:CEM35039.1 unnamed protein product [Vitrella brassicaformis CCMP3155]
MSVTAARKPHRCRISYPVAQADLLHQKAQAMAEFSHLSREGLLERYDHRCMAKRTLRFCRTLDWCLSHQRKLAAQTGEIQTLSINLGTCGKEEDDVSGGDWLTVMPGRSTGSPSTYAPLSSLPSDPSRQDIDGTLMNRERERESSFIPSSPPTGPTKPEESPETPHFAICSAPVSPTDSPQPQASPPSPFSSPIPTSLSSSRLLHPNASPPTVHQLRMTTPVAMARRVALCPVRRREELGGGARSSSVPPGCE